MAVNLITDFRWTTVRDEIRDEMLAVPSVVLVHPFLRWDGQRNANEQRFRKKFIPEGQAIINAWTIMRVSEDREWLTNREILIQVIARLEFWYELNDDEDSQDTFDDIVDDVKTRFQAPIRLDSTVEIQGPLLLTVEDHRFFAGKLVHHAELETVVQHRVFQDQPFR